MPSPPALSRQAIREIAHELRSPLGGFEAMLELLAETPLTPEQARLVEALEASAQHLRAILARVLPPHAGETREAPRLGALLEAIAASAQARAEKKGLTFALEIDRALDRLAEIDALGLRQVLENLIDNAIRATEQGGVTLAVAPGGEGRIAFRLADCGAGLDPALAERLMSDGPKSGPKSGLGLGIASRLVARGGGTLHAEPGAAGQGTVFLFDWPIAAPSGQGRLLIVDDHPASRLVLKTILSALGFACEEATDPASALRRLKDQPFAAVFTDLHMPEGGGRMLLAALAESPGRPPAVIVSADDPREDAALDGLFEAAILKPLTVPAIVAVLRQLGLSPAAKRAA